MTHDVHDNWKARPVGLPAEVASLCPNHCGGL